MQRNRTVVLAAAASMAIGTASQTADALNIVLNFDSGQSDSPSFDSTGALLQDLFEYAEWHYQSIIEDSHTLTINYWYDDLSGNTLGVHNLVSQSGGRETEGNIRIDTNFNTGGSERNWYIDTTPFNHSEFDMQQTLWRDLNTTVQNDWYTGSVSDLFEVGYEGAAVSGGAADGLTDMLTVVLHEVGHALGMSSANPSTVTETSDGDYDFAINFIDGDFLAVETANNSGDDNQNIAHVENTDALMTPFTPASTRRLPSATDIFAMAAGHSYTDIDLFRQDMWEAGSMNNSSKWAGDQVPDQADDAYLRHGSTGFLSAAFRVQNLTLAEESDVNTRAFDLTVDNDTIVRWASTETKDTELIVESGGSLTTEDLRLFGGELDLQGGTATVTDYFEIQFDQDTGTTQAGLLFGHGTLTVNGQLENQGEIRASGGLLILRTDGTGDWDLDGNSGDGEVNAIDGNIWFQNGSLNDAYDGVMTVGNNNDIRYVDFDIDWELNTGGVLNLEGGVNAASVAEIRGTGVATISGDINADGWTEFDTDMIINAAADVALFDADTTLELGFTTSEITYNGGDFTGPGTLKQEGDGNVSAGSLVNIDTDLFDFDGTGSGNTTIENGGRMNVTGTGLTDEHNGTITLNGDAVLNMDMFFELIIIDPFADISASQTDGGVNEAALIPASWTMANTLNLNAAAGTPQVIGSSRMIVTGTINVNDGDAQVLSPVTFQPGSSVNTTANDDLLLQGPATFSGGTFAGGGTVDASAATTINDIITVNNTLELNGTTQYTGATVNGTGTLRQNGTATVSGDTTIAVATFDMDGNSGGNTIWNVDPGITLKVNAPIIDSGGSPFDGTLNIVSGTAAINTAAAWELDGTVNLIDDGGGVPSLTGTQVIVSNGGEISFEGGTGLITADTQFEPGSAVGVANGGGARLSGQVTLFGGSFTGGGSAEFQIGGATTLDGDITVTGLVQQEGDVTVTGPSTINGTGIWDLDGIEPGTTWTLNNDLTLNMSEVDNAGEAYNGDLNINGTATTLTVNTTLPWTMAGVMNIDTNTTSTFFPSIAGQAMTLSGTANIDGGTRFNALTTITGDVNFADVVSALNLSSVGTAGNDHRIEGGKINATGTLLASGNNTLTGFGSIAADLNFVGDSKLMADDGTLTITNSIDSGDKLGDEFGTADSDGILNVTSSWSTDRAGAVVLNGGEITGATIFNTNIIRGHGTITALQVINDGTIAAEGGELIVDLVNNPDLDGGGNGTLAAVDGDLTVVDAVTDPHTGDADVGAGRTMTFHAGWTLFNGGTLTLKGNGIANPATVAGSQQTLRAGSTTNIIDETRFDLVTTFEGNTSLSDANDVLRLFADATVSDTAAFSGNGRLVNTSGNTLALDDRAQVGVQITNEGQLTIGNSPGVAAARSFSQTKGGSLLIELQGTAPGSQHDQLVVTDNVTLAGTLEVALLGGFDPVTPSVSAGGGGDQFTIITANAISGTFSSVAGLDFDNLVETGRELLVEYNPTDVTLSAFQYIAGDTDFDRQVDILDIRNILIAGKFGVGPSAATWAEGDFDNDGDVDASDIQLILTGGQFGEGVYAAAADLIAIPEPTSLALLGLGSLTLIRRRTS